MGHGGDVVVVVVFVFPIGSVGRLHCCSFTGVNLQSLPCVVHNFLFATEAAQLFGVHARHAHEEALWGSRSARSDHVCGGLSKLWSLFGSRIRPVL